MTGPIIPADDFRGENAKLIACIGALLSMDADGALVPHGIGGHARSLLAAAAARIPAETAPAIDLEQFRPFVQPERDKMASLAERLGAERDALPVERLSERDAIGVRLRGVQAKLADADRLLALIDGSKAGEVKT